MDRRIHAGMDRPIHCPALSRLQDNRHPWPPALRNGSAGRRCRCRRRPGATPARVMVFVPPPAPVALTDLLESFRSALQVADKLSPVLTVRAGDGRLTRAHPGAAPAPVPALLPQPAHLPPARAPQARVPRRRRARHRPRGRAQRDRPLRAGRAAGAGPPHLRVVRGLGRVQRDRDLERRHGARAGAADQGLRARCAARSRASSRSTPTG